MVGGGGGGGGGGGRGERPWLDRHFSSGGQHYITINSVLLMLSCIAVIKNVTRV